MFRNNFKTESLHRSPISGKVYDGLLIDSNLIDVFSCWVKGHPASWG